jgi:hypothetical protein
MEMKLFEAIIHRQAGAKLGRAKPGRLVIQLASYVYPFPILLSYSSTKTPIVCALHTDLEFKV